MNIICIILKKKFIKFTDIEKVLDRFDKETDKVLHPNAVNVIKKLYNLTPDNLKSIYFNDDPITMENLEKLIDLIGDLNFVEGVHRILKNQVETSCSPTYFYQLTYDKGPSIIKKLLRTEMSGIKSQFDPSSKRFIQIKIFFFFSLLRCMPHRRIKILVPSALFWRQNHIPRDRLARVRNNRTNGRDVGEFRNDRVSKRISNNRKNQ